MASSVDGTATYSYDTVNQVTGASYVGTNQPANESNRFAKDLERRSNENGDEDQYRAKS